MGFLILELQHSLFKIEGFNLALQHSGSSSINVIGMVGSRDMTIHSYESSSFIKLLSLHHYFYTFREPFLLPASAVESARLYPILRMYDFALQ